MRLRQTASFPAFHNELIRVSVREDGILSHTSWEVIWPKEIFLWLNSASHKNSVIYGFLTVKFILLKQYWFSLSVSLDAVTMIIYFLIWKVSPKRTSQLCNYSLQAIVSTITTVERPIYYLILIRSRGS